MKKLTILLIVVFGLLITNESEAAKLKLKEGQAITTEQGYIITKAIGRLENLTYAHLSGVMSNPDSVKLQIRCKVVFYAEDAITGDLKPCYEIGVSKDDLGAIEMLTQTANGPLVFNIIENAIYNYIIQMDEYKDLFEITQ